MSTFCVLLILKVALKCPHFAQKWQILDYKNSFHVCVYYALFKGL